jgi:hypothetical protein
LAIISFSGFLPLRFTGRWYIVLVEMSERRNPETETPMKTLNRIMTTIRVTGLISSAIWFVAAAWLDNLSADYPDTFDAEYAEWLDSLPTQAEIEEQARLKGIALPF